MKMTDTSLTKMHVGAAGGATHPLRRTIFACVWTPFLLLSLAACVPVSAPDAERPPDPVPAPQLPELLADLALTPKDAEIVDVAVDHAAGRVYVGDSARTLYIVDAAELILLATLPDAGGYLTLDSTSRRLYAATGSTYVETESDARVVVLDTTTDAELARIPGRWLGVDADGGRLFVGDGVAYDTPADAPGIRIFDASTFTPLGEIPQPGVPLWNPLRDELVIVGYSVFTADPATQRVAADLFPGLTEGIPFRFCNGCAWAEWARIFPDEGLIAVNIQGHAPQGSGPIAPLTWLDARTLAPIAPADAPELQATCGSGGTVLHAVDGRIYRSRRYARYVVYNTLFVEGTDGAQITWRDGIYAYLINPVTRQAYLRDGQVLALPELTPLGTWPVGCIFVDDHANGRVYAARQGTLRIISTHGGAPVVPPPEPAHLPAAPVIEIVPSPAFAVDGSLLVRSSEGRVYRSTDGGDNWMLLRGGLPADPDLTLGVIFSPDYANDRTLFAYGMRRDYWGEGVLRSVDGGDTWTRGWGDLTHLRVTDLTASAAFAADTTLVATAAFAPADGSLPGRSLQRSTDGGATWRVIATVDSSGDLPPLADVLPVAAAPALPVRATAYDTALEFTLDGETWLPVPFALRDGEWVRAIQAAPTGTDAIYVMTDLNLYRATDGGRTWQRWDDPRLAGRTYLDELTALAVVPRVNGGHGLFVGTAAGEFWALNPAELTWANMGAAVGPTPAPPATAVPIATLAPTPTPALAAQTPPPGRFRPQGPFADLWATDSGAQMLLGWALAPDATPLVVATQPFERGEMLWRGDTAQIYARFDAMGWQAYVDTFNDGDAAADANLAAPSGLLQPVRGFGKVWREQAGVRELLGWATAEEQGGEAYVQEFERGIAIYAAGRTLVFGTTLDGTRGWLVR